MKDGFKNAYSVCVHRAGRLTWHDVIPSDEVWIKLGGGGTFKMSFQIVNVPSPNCPQNTCVFCCFEADDNITNLHVHIALNHFQDQVEELQRIKWRLVQIMFVQKIKLFLCGDYDFFSMMYGLSGACGALILDVNKTHYD